MILLLLLYSIQN